MVRAWAALSIRADDRACQRRVIAVATIRPAAPFAQPGPFAAVKVEIQVATTIRRRRPAVSAVLLDPTRDADWTAGLQDVEGDAPMVAGNRVIRHFRGGVADEQTVMQVVEDRVIVLRRDHPFPMVLRYDLERIPEGTLLRVTLIGQIGLLRRVFMPGAVRRFRRRLVRDLAALKDMIETGNESFAPRLVEAL